MARKRRRARRRGTRQNHRKRNLLIFPGVVFVIVLAVTVLLVTRQAEQIETDRLVSFQEAQADIRLQQVYIDQLVGRIGKPAYVDRILYNAEQYQSEAEPVISWMTTTSLGDRRIIPPYGGKTRSLIEVYSAAFEGSISARSEEEIVLGLKHEFRHAEQLYNGQVRNFPSTLFRTNDGEQSGGLWSFVQELDAVQSIDSVILSRERQIEFNTDVRIRSLYFSLWANGLENIDPAFLSQLKVEFFCFLDAE